MVPPFCIYNQSGWVAEVLSTFLARCWEGNGWRGARLAKVEGRAVAAATGDGYGAESTRFWPRLACLSSCRTSADPPSF